MDDSLKHECREAIDRLYRFLDGELTSETRQQIQRHLDDCPPCIKAFEFEAELRIVVSKGCREQVPESLRMRIAALLDQERGLR
jgi:mycothiol system anti-sigma-R factor